MKIDRSLKCQRGTGLIEVLVTAFVLAVGLLGLAVLQLKTIQYNHGAYLRSQATILATDIVDRLRINRQNALNGNYNIAYDVTPVASTTLVSTDLVEWKGLLAQILPSGDGAVNCDVDACSVSVRWRERAGADTAVTAGADPTQVPIEFTYSTRI